MSKPAVSFELRSGLALMLILGLGPSAGCDRGEQQASSPADAAAEVQRGLKLRAFVRGLERERYLVSHDDADLSHGASDPLVTIVEFVDYASPDLAAHERLEQLLAAHPQQLRVVILHHPSTDAALAARAVLAAHAQGQGWAMHARLLTQSDALQSGDLRRHAAAVGVPDLARFEQSMQTTVGSGVLADVEQAQRLGIERRPTLFVNGVALVGPQAADSLADVFEVELETASKLLALGARRDEVYATLMSRAARDRIEPELPVEPSGPFEIPWKPDFAVSALSSELRDEGVFIEELVEGEGPALVEGKIIEFEFAGYATATGKQVMGSREGPAKLVLNQAARERDEIGNAMIIGLLGMRVGGKRRIKVPAAIVDADRPEGRADVGDLWMGVDLISISDAPKLEPEAAFAGKPIASERRDDGLEIYDYRRGKGRVAKAGMIVTSHYIAQLADGTEFDNSHARAEGMSVTLGPEPGVIRGFAQGLEGARVGMLRKLVIPPELAYADTERGKIPANSTLVFFLQIMDVQPAEQ